jgi:D-beta-D-heptose 7-phosphate kinase/D-beta-D-heptose 1-phosphate adenosyltransferase
VSGSAEKIRTRAAAVDWRQQQSGSVVFTNGVFDLLHPGHVELIEAARAHGSHLIVGVNSDASARRLAKGTARPVIAEADRARVIAALETVDCVVIFEEDTPLELVRELRPDVLVKGGDYAPEDVVGGDVVRSSGGRVVIVPLVEGYSTTSIVERLRASS